MPVRSSVANTIKEVRDNPMSGELNEIGRVGKNFLSAHQVSDEWREDKGCFGWFFVPEGHMTVARRFIAGSGSTSGPCPGGTPEYRRSKLCRGSVFAKLNRFSHEISVVPPGTRANSNTGTGDKSPAYFPFVPPGQTAPATALLNAEMCNGDRFEVLLIFAPLHQSLTWCTRAGGSFPPPSSRGRTEPLPDCQTPHVY